MDYKGIEYSVLQTANPLGWKWTVFLAGIRTRTGIAHSRAHAVLDAERAIDKAMKDLDRMKGRRSWRPLSLLSAIWGNHRS